MRECDCYYQRKPFNLSGKGPHLWHTSTWGRVLCHVFQSFFFMFVGLSTLVLSPVILPSRRCMVLVQGYPVFHSDNLLCVVSQTLTSSSSLYHLLSEDLPDTPNPNRSLACTWQYTCNVTNMSPKPNSPVTRANYGSIHSFLSVDPWNFRKVPVPDTFIWIRMDVTHTENDTYAVLIFAWYHMYITS